MDIVEILKLGLPGLVFLLSMFSYRLLAREQHRDKPSTPILKSIRHYMYLNILLAILTASAPLIENQFSPLGNDTFNVEAKLSGTELESGVAAVCKDAAYKGRYILITDVESMKMVQVHARGFLPCTQGEFIALNSEDVVKLGWTTTSAPTLVEVSAAGEGQKYILHKS